MADLALPANLGDTLRELRSRVSNLERSPRLPASSIQGGKLTILDDAGNVVAYIGEHTGPGGTEEVGIYLPGSSVGMSEEHGLYAPGIQVNARPPQTTRTTTSATFETVWQYCPRFVQSSAIQAMVAIASDAATTGEVRLQVQDSLGNLSYSATQAVPASNPSTYFTWNLDLRLITPPLPKGASGFVNVQARRTSGTGLVHLFEPLPLYFAHPAAIGATATGV